MVFQFLDLPAELRNNVYEYYSNPGPPLTFMTKDKSKTEGTAAVAKLPLSHTCRQIRLEYLAIQRRNATVEVSLIEVVDYLDTFHSEVAPQAVHIRLPTAPIGGSNVWTNLLPIIRKAALMCNTQFAFAQDKSCPEVASIPVELNQLLNHRDPVWQKLVLSGDLTDVSFKDLASTDIYIALIYGPGKAPSLPWNLTLTKWSDQVLKSYGFADYRLGGERMSVIVWPRSHQTD